MEAYRGNELTRNSSGNACPQSAKLNEPLWTDPGLKGEIGVCKLISTEKKKKEKKERRLALIRANFHQNPYMRRESRHRHHSLFNGGSNCILFIPA